MRERGAAWAENAYRELAARGHRTGGARGAVIERLARAHGCCTAAELTRGLREGDRELAAASVYRSLNALERAGLVRAAELGDGERRWELVHPDGAHHHHVVCEHCGRAVPFEDPALEAAIADAAERLGADVRAHDVVLHGRCAACGRATG